MYAKSNAFVLKKKVKLQQQQQASKQASKQAFNINYSETSTLHTISVDAMGLP